MSRRRTGSSEVLTLAAPVLLATCLFLGSPGRAGAGGTDSDPGAGALRVGDPFETVNRKIFWFNEQVDRFALEPLASGWAWVTPEAVRRSVRNVFENARFPIQVANHLLQGKPTGALADTGRFVVNSTVGIGGLFDPAARLGLTSSYEDFGQTLGYWGTPAGPYLVLPLLGPSTPRDTLGLAADGASAVYPYFVPFWVSAAIATGDVVNRRSLLLEEVRENRRAAFDYYVFLRNAYLQYRGNQLEDAAASEPPERDDDLYYLDEEED